MEQTTSRVLPARRRSCYLQGKRISLCLMSRFDFFDRTFMPKRIRGAADEKLFTVAAAFNRPRDPCDPFLLCASNPLGGRALWVAPSVASASKMHEWVERSEKRARLAPDIRQNSGLTKLQFGTRRPLA